MIDIKALHTAAVVAALVAVALAAQTSGDPPYQFLPGTNDTFIETPATSNSTAALFSVATSPGAEGIRRIGTPWPITVGKSAFSTVGAIAFMIDYLAHGGKIPSVGIVLSLETFKILTYPLEKAFMDRGQFHWTVKRTYLIFLYIAVCIVGIGTILFIASGALELARHGLNIGSIAIGVYEGCPGGVTTPAFAQNECANVAPYDFGVLTDSDTIRLVFWAAGCLLVLANIPLLVKILRNPGEHFGRQGSPMYKKIALYVAAITTLLAIAGQSADTAAVSELYYDCRNATQQPNGNWTGCVQDMITFPGSPSGFWDVWVEYNVIVVESIFAW